MDQIIPLTSAEISNLWNTYINDELAICVLSHFNNTVMDTEIKPVIEETLKIAQKHLQVIRNIFKSENYAIPHGFTKEDVNLDAPALFSDPFYLHYIKQMSRTGLIAHGLALSLAARQDIRKFYDACCKEVAVLDHMVTDLLLHKGIYIRAPYIVKPKQVEYVKDSDFLGSIFGKQRPLLAVEITHLYGNMQANSLRKTLAMGFSQVAKSKEVRKYMVRGRDIASKHLNTLQSFLDESHLKAPITWNDTVTDSTKTPFSDKLMMFHIGAVTTIALADYGAAFSSSLRMDESISYGNLISELALFAKDGAKIMIQNGWMEKPPQAADRDKLSNK